MKAETPTPLPLDLAWPELAKALAAHMNLVLVAEPGAGKTTRFPPRLIGSGFISADKKILMLEPRRLAARAAAHRIGEEQGWKVGAEVGYQVRFENRTSRETRLEILTEGLLTKRLQADPELKSVGAVILDEFHERSQHTDLALALLFELQQLSRPDLRLIVMSATLDAERVASYLGDAPIVKVPGRTHPVAIQHAKKPLALETGPGFLDRMSELVRDLIEGREKREGDVLVFLPGAREIRGVRERIEGAAQRAGFACHELHGSLALEDQDRAIRKSSAQKKIVLATNIAETSLTIDGVGTVVDSGLARVVRLDGAGFERLQLSRISLASATQRAGRAGRQGPGLCYRLWTKLDEASMSPFEQPELLRTDLSEAVLSLLSQGVTDPDGFSWFEKPPAQALRFAVETLGDLGFRDSKSGALTEIGREALKLPVSARLARLLIEATAADQISLGARMAALLSEKDIALRGANLKRQAAVESDILIRLHMLESKSTEADRFAVRNVERVAEHLERACERVARAKLGPSKLKAQKKALENDEIAQRLLLLAFPDRLCRRRRAKEPQARMVGGRGVTIAPYSAVETAALFVALDSSEPPAASAAGAKLDAQISLASSVERGWIEEFFSAAVEKRSQIVFEETSESVQKQTALMFHDLPLEEPHLSRPTGDEAHALLFEAARAKFDIRFATHESLSSWLERLRFVEETFADDEKIDANFDFDVVKSKALEEACYGETKLNDVLAKPLAEIFTRHLPSALARLLDEAAPEAILVPSGSRIRLHYPPARPPYLEVRIQEVFGLKESPKVARGRVPVVMHLLGPNYRPVQVTSDLQSFWRSGYVEVRKELRSRYPKHSWPEDPTNAVPVAKGRPRQ